MPLDINEVKDNLHKMLRNASARWSPVSKTLLNRLTESPEIINDESFQRTYQKLLEKHTKYFQKNETWISASYPEMAGEVIAYFTPEIKIEHLKALMSGGLGVLAGEVVEALGDIGVETVGISLLYKNLWNQKIDADGNQTITFSSEYLKQQDLKIEDIATLIDAKIKLNLVNQEITINVWLVMVGKAKIILLEDPDGITDTLYDQKRERINNREIELIRLKQELILGRGGILALNKLNIKPSLIHMNEAHCIFAATSLKDARDEGGDMANFFKDTRCVFTTHTPVPAGMRRYPLNHFVLLGLDVNKYWQYFVTRPRDHFGHMLLGEEGVDLTFAGMILSSLNNAVSQEHSNITKTMFPEFREKITGITNGIYVSNWQMDELQNENLDKIDIVNLKRKYKEKYINQINLRTGTHLKPDILTITIARRITGYKQNDFILSNQEQIKNILHTAGGRGIQIVFAGKSHPSDTHGQSVMKKIVQLSNTKDFKDKLVFVPEYDVDFARIAAQGSDIWLSNPEEKKEACATSYMKALCNGTIAITTPSGGVLEHVIPVPDQKIYEYLERKLKNIVNIDNLKNNPAHNGFYILSAVANAPEKHEPENIETLYRALKTAAELYYNYTDEWVKLMTHAIESTPRFDILEVAKQYVERLYLPVIRSKGIIELHETKQIKPLSGHVVPAGRLFGAEVKITLKRGISPENIGVQLWYGQDRNKEFNGLPMKNWEKITENGSEILYRYWDYFALPPGVNYYTARAYVKPAENLNTHIYRYVGKPRQDKEIYSVPIGSKAKELLANPSNY
ncbi:MAG: glycogen/starch/alpha-glucan phosphorylase [bacterium]